MGKQRAYMSFGGGVQSTAIAMLAINRDERLLKATGGVLPELYIFADTGDEPKALYPHIEDMKQRIEGSGADFKTVKRKGEKLSAHVVGRYATGGRPSPKQLPFFTKNEDGDRGILRRACTMEFKTLPIQKHLKSIGASGQLWLGISKDEERRAKVGPVPGNETLEFFQPLLAMNWHRADCENYLAEIGVAAMRSACVFCPFHSMNEWREVAKRPEDWQRALAFDEALEWAAERWGGLGTIRNECFLNDKLVRLRDLDLTEPDDPQQRLWDNECAGVCGV